MGYRNVLARGYAVARGADGRILRAAAAARRAGRLEVEFHDGRVAADIAGGGAQGRLL